MNKMEIEAKAYEEAQRLLETSFSFDNPYTCEIDDSEIPFSDRDFFYAEVEKVLSDKGEEIKREGRYFKICRYNKK